MAVSAPPRRSFGHLSFEKGSDRENWSRQSGIKNRLSCEKSEKEVSEHGMLQHLPIVANSKSGSEGAAKKMGCPRKSRDFHE